MKRRLRERLGELRSERGIALPMAMLITVIALGLAAVPIMASVNSQSGGNRSQAGNEALAAAETGAELAVLRQSQVLPEAKKPCVAVEGDEKLKATETSKTVEGASWCSAVGGSVGSASYSYEVNPCYADANGERNCGASCENPAEEDLIRVVSTGTGNDGGEVPKRIQLTACSAYKQNPDQIIPGGTHEVEEIVLHSGETTVINNETITGETTITVPKEEPVTTTSTTYSYGTTSETIPPPNVFAKGQIVGIEWLNMNNNAQVYGGGAGSNGSVSMSGSANVCGTVSYGTTFTTDNSSSNKAPSNCSAGRTAGKGTSEYPNVTLPSDISTNNSDSRLAALDPVGPSVWQRGNISWNSSNRSLTVSYDQLTLEGTAPYYLCKLTLAGGSKLLAGTGKKIRIFFDAPQNCPGLNGSAQLQIANGAYVGADSYDGPGFYFVGSTNASYPSKVELGGGASVSQFVVYGPQTTIVANNGVNLSGVIIGKNLELGGGAAINKSTFTPPPTSDFLGSTVLTRTTTTPQYSTTIYMTTTTTTSKHSTTQTIPRTTTVPYTYTTTNKKTVTDPDTTVPGTKEPLSFNKRLFVECTSQPIGATPNSGC